MAEGIQDAALAFDASVAKAENPAATPGHRNIPVEEGPPIELFKNVGKLEVDDESPRKGGGDEDDFDPEELIYGKRPKAKAKSPPRDPGKGDAESDEEHPDDADGDDDDESDDGADDEEEEEEGDEDSADLKRKVEVTVDGEPVEVTLKEALEGYVRTETFHRRMNQLDEAKKIVRRAAADAVQNYEYSMNVAKQMQAHMDTMIPKEPNWDEEFQKDPVKARELQRYYEKANGFRAQMQQQMQEVNQKVAQSNATQLAAFAEEESAKFEADNRKTWSDPKKKAKDLSSMRRTGLTAGFSEEELSQVYDSRMLKVLLKASKYDRMVASRPQPVKKVVAKPIPPGTGSAKQRTVQKGVTSAMRRLNQTGSMEDAAVVFDQIIARS
jgi:hypothetical protein